MAKKKADSKDTLTVYYSKTESGGGICEGQEDTDWPNYNDIVYEHKVQGISLLERRRAIWGQCYDTFEVDFKPKNGLRVWLVKVVYDSGSTFGRSLNHVHFVGIFLDEEAADKLAKSIKDDTYEEAYKPWQGYFERFQYAEVSSYVVGDVEVVKRY